MDVRAVHDERSDLRGRRETGEAWMTRASGNGGVGGDAVNVRAKHHVFG